MNWGKLESKGQPDFNYHFADNVKLILLAIRGNSTEESISIFIVLFFITFCRGTLKLSRPPLSEPWWGPLRTSSQVVPVNLIRERERERERERGTCGEEDYSK